MPVKTRTSAVKPKRAPKYAPVKATPVKSFFVTMLTRDISLEEAILDLIDNCVDGILRSDHTSPRSTKSTKPYRGHHASIEFGPHSFTISDNCGGIPWKLHDYAFRLGRDKNRMVDAPGGVGVYGIGMKRAIFKLGTECLISTQHRRDRYEIEISSKWLDEEDNWDIPVKPGKKAEEDGTTIYVTGLHDGVIKRFSDDPKAFQADLARMVATHYAFIIDKGFSVSINGIVVQPKPTRLLFSEGKSDAPAIRPFIYKTESDGVEVFLTVGFTRPIPSTDEVASEQEEKGYSSEDAGWTVLCNDRAVLYCDRTEMTGWGEAGVPRYHTQFIAVAGIVEFKSKDPQKLPTTTTKRGIDASSSLYLQVKNKMRDGMRLFTNYTNKWKAMADQSRKHMKAADAVSFEDIKALAIAMPLRATSGSGLAGQQYNPKLPLPRKSEPRNRRISFAKEVDAIRRVGAHLFDDPDRNPSEIAEQCFDLVLEEAPE